MTPRQLKKARKSLAELVPDAIGVLKTSLKGQISVAQLSAINLILRGSGLISDARHGEKRGPSKAAAAKVTVRYSAPVVKDDAE